MKEIVLPEMTQEQFEAITLPLRECLESDRALIAELVKALEEANKIMTGGLEYKGPKFIAELRALGKEVLLKAKERLGK